MAHYEHVFMWWSLLVVIIDSTNGSRNPVGEHGNRAVPAARPTTSHLSCNCPEGFFSKGKLTIFTAADICNNSRRFKKTHNTDRDLVINAELKPDEMMSSEKLIPMTMKICQSCATGCSLCLGPDDNDCLKCLPGYLVNYYQQETTSDDSTKLTLLERKKRTTSNDDSRMINSNPGIQSNQDVTRRIYEEEGLLATTTVIYKQHESSKSQTSKRPRVKTEPEPISNDDDDSDFYVDDNFMSFESDESSGYEENQVGTLNPSRASTMESGARHQLPLTPKRPLAMIPQNRFDNKDNVDIVDYYGDVESSFLEETVKFQLDSTTTASNSQKQHHDHVPETNLEQDQRMTELMSGDAIEWHGSSPFSCVSTCPRNFYADEDDVCQACHSECNGCIDGNGPNHCLKCRHFHEDGRCVTTCRRFAVDNVINASSNNCSFLFDQLFREQARREEISSGIPSGYYVILSLIVLAVILFGFLDYYRKRYRMQLNLPCTTRGRANRNTNRDHEDHKKCFLNRNKERSSTTDLKLSTSPMRNRPGNAYVYATERSLLPSKLTLHNDSLSISTKSAFWMPNNRSSGGTKDTDDEDFHESDPLYETPDSTWGRRRDDGTMDEMGRQLSTRRQSSASTQCYLIPSKAKIKVTHDEDLPEVSTTVGISGTSPDVSSPHPFPLPKTAAEENEAPGFEAPSLPSRNSPNPEHVTNDDHIYVNID